MQTNRSRHPTNLWNITLANLLYMACFASIVSSLSLYLIRHSHYTNSQTYILFGTFTSLVFVTPVVGGFIVERWGYLRCAYLGLICVLASCIFLICTHYNVIPALILLIMCNAVYTPASYCLLDFSYKKEDPRRDAGFTIMYMGMNIGAAVGIFAGGWLHHEISYNMEFFVDALFVVLAMLALHPLIKHRNIDLSRAYAFQAKLKDKFLSLLAIFIAGTLVIAFFLLHPEANHFLQTGLAVFATTYIITLVLRTPTYPAKIKLISLAILLLIGMIFWMIYNLEPSLLSVFVKEHVHRTVLSYTIPADSFYGFSCLFIVLSGMVTAKLWRKLSATGKPPSLFTQIGIGIMCVGLGFFYLHLLITHLHFHHKIPLFLMVWVYLFFGVAELLIAPISISMVGKLSPPGREGGLIGIAQLSMGISAFISSKIALSTVLTPHGAGVHASQLSHNLGPTGHVATPLSHYTSLFQLLAITLLAAGTVTLLLHYVLKKRWNVFKEI